MTNYEKIKQMSIDEMAEFIGECDYCNNDLECNGNCDECCKKWLESEASK